MESVCSNDTEKCRAYEDEKEQKFHKDIASLFLSSGLPPQSVCGVGFRGFIRTLNPSYRVKSEFIEPLYYEIYEEQKAKVKEILRNNDGRISLSIDLLEVEYMRVTAHFIDDDWETKSLVLFGRSVCIPGDPGLNEALLNCIAEFEIEAKLCAITEVTNDDFNEAFPIIKDTIQLKKNLALDGMLFRVVCCADIFSSMVRDAFEQMNKTMGKLHLLYSPGRSEPVWNVVGYLETVLKLEAEGEYMSDNKYLVGFEVLSSAEWDKARGVFKLVNTIYKAGFVMFETKHATANVYLHLLREVQETLTRESTNPDKFVADLATKLVKRVNDYCKEMFMVLAVTTVMDPRFKMKYIEFSCSKYAGSSTGEGCSDAAVVLEAVRKLYEDYVTENPVEAMYEDYVTENPVEAVGAGAAKSDLFSCDREEEDSEEEDSDEDDMEEEEYDSEKEDMRKGEEFLRKEEEKCQEECRGYYSEFSLFSEYCLLAQSTTHSGKSELDRYLEEHVLSWEQDFNVISWWKESSSKYPTLSKMARDILAIQMTVATSYDNYYTHSRVIEAKLKATTPELMNAIMCSESWMGQRRKENSKL